MKNFIIPAIALLLPTLAMAEDCVVSGGGQLCVEKSKASTGATQEGSDAYGCYKLFAECTTLSDGKCGWKDKGSLSQCLKDPAEFKPQMTHGAPAVPDQIAPPIKKD